MFLPGFAQFSIDAGALEFLLNGLPLYIQFTCLWYSFVSLFLRLLRIFETIFPSASLSCFGPPKANFLSLYFLTGIVPCPCRIVFALESVWLLRLTG